MAAPFPSPTAKWHTTTYSTLSPERPELSAKGKTIVITGGGTGIGAETARYFARAGASRIALLGRREQPLLDTKASIHEINKDVDVFVASTDITKKEQVDSAFENFVKAKRSSSSSLKASTIDILISNAAVTGPIEPISAVEATAFAESVCSNIKGALYVAQAFLRHATPQDAVVVDVNSSAAHVNFGPVFTAYSVAKWALYRLWDCVAFEHDKVGMRVYHIQPGVVDTDMNRAAGGVKAIGFEDHVSLPASFMVWLASPEAKFLKGKFLWANWDVDELISRSKEIEEGTIFNIQLGGWPFGHKGEIPQF